MAFERLTDSFQTTDGTQLFARAWLAPAFDPARVLVVHHGVGEHSDRYGNLIDALADTGISVFCHDARGHGRSEGVRGHARGIGQLVDDLEAYILLLRDRYGIDKPVLLGHSLGGLVATCFALRFSNQWELLGLMTSAPALKVHVNPVQQLKLTSARLLFRVTPDLVMPTGLPLDDISHDEAVKEAYRTDPLVHDKLSIRLGLSIVQSGQTAIRDARRLQIPLWMGHGQADRITDPAGSVDFFRRARSEDKHLRLYPDLFHEIFNETPSERSLVLDDVRDWLVERLPAGANPAAGPTDSGASSQATTGADRSTAAAGL